MTRMLLVNRVSVCFLGIRRDRRPSRRIRRDRFGVPSLDAGSTRKTQAEPGFKASADARMRRQC